MPAVLQKLKRIRTQLGGGSATDVETPFDVACSCGARVTGVRRASWIEAECPKCCRGVFVLPVNVYPATPSVNSEVLGGTFSERLKTVVAEMLPDRPQKDAQPDGKPKKRRSARGEVADDHEGDFAPETDEVVARPRGFQLPKLRLPSLDIKAALRRTFTPFRLLMLSMVAVVGVTAYWMSYQKRVEAAQQTWLKSAEQVEEFLTAADMVNLESTLQSAVDAGYTLGKNDSEWRLWLNMLKETHAVNTMATSDLLTGFAAVYNEENQLVPDAEQRLTTTATSGTFIFDAWLTAAGNESGVYVMEFPAAPGRHTVEVYVPIAQLEDLIAATGDERVVFAAKFQTVKVPGEPANAWQLLVDADSFSLITNATHCDAVGLRVEEDPELSTVLQRQEEFVKSSSTWEHRAADAVLPQAFVSRPEPEWNDD